MADTVSTVLCVHDPTLRRRLSGLLASEASVWVAAECASGAAAVEAVLDYQPELVLLDAQLPDMDVFEAVEAIGVASMPSVVFLTRLDSSLLRVFEVHGIPYLLQPFSDDRFRSALRRAMLRIEPRALAGVRRRLERMLAADEEGSRARRVPVRNAGKTQFVHLDDIRWVEGAGEFSRLHLDDRTHVVKASLDELADRFADGFLRIHSTLVRTSEVAEIERTDAGEALVKLRDGRQLVLSEDARPEVIPAT